MTDVFVSYKAEDRRRVRPLVEALKADGYSVWWDEQIGGGAAPGLARLDASDERDDPGRCGIRRRRDVLQSLDEPGDRGDAGVGHERRKVVDRGHERAADLLLELASPLADRVLDELRRDPLGCSDRDR